MSTPDLPADRCALVVDLAAIRANWRAVRQSFTGAGVGAVVKQDAYGLGIAEVVPLLAALGCRDFWVADLTEAEDVRRSEPSGRIFVLHGLCGGTPRDFRMLGAIPVLLDMSEVEAMARAATDAPVTCAIHLDTGLNRLGIGLEDVRRLVAAPDRLKRLQIAAYVTHLAHFSDPGARANAWQWRRFSAWTRRLPPAPLSFCASSGVFGPRERHADLARVGSALYGVETTPSRPQPIVAAATLTAPILRVHDVPAGREVGYSGAYRTPSARRLAQLGIGYGDGVPYRFHSDAYVLIAGHRAPVVSTSAMSLMSVDVTGLPEQALRPGQRAMLFGPGLPVDQIAAAAGVAPNVVHVRAGRSAPRFYLPCPDDAGAGTAATARPLHAPQMV
jgi:alanine racemase